MKIDCTNTLFCENLRDLRKKREMSRLELARQAGVPRCLIKMLEESEVAPVMEYDQLEQISPPVFLLRKNPAPSSEGAKGSGTHP